MQERTGRPRQSRRFSPILAAAGFYFFVVFCGLVPPAAADDSYIAGYAAALIENEFELSATVHVADGVVTVYCTVPTRADRHKLVAALKQIRGVVSAELVDSRRLIPQPAAGATVVETRAVPSHGLVFPRGLLFEPLHADPRWPHFSAAYRGRVGGSDPSTANQTFAGNFGETFALYRNAAPFDGQWEFAMQAGVFSIFDVGSPSGSQDQIGADYTVAGMVNYRTGPLSGFFRFSHLSAHLGDEYILNSTTPVTRLGASFDGIDTKWSYDVLEWLRLYGGIGYVIKIVPSDLGRWTSQFGTELVCPRTFFWDTVRPVAYADFQVNQRTDWSIGRSFMAGFRFEHFQIMDRNIQFLLEYYGGPSPNGDFLFRQTQWFGIGIHFYL